MLLRNIRHSSLLTTSVKRYLHAHSLRVKHTAFIFNFALFCSFCNTHHWDDNSLNTGRLDLCIKRHRPTLSIRNAYFCSQCNKTAAKSHHGIKLTMPGSVQIYRCARAFIDRMQSAGGGLLYPVVSAVETDIMIYFELPAVISLFSETAQHVCRG